MAKTLPPALCRRGEWRKGEYQTGEAVAYDGSSYIATATTKAEPPGRGWDLLAAQGERGAKGDKGRAGDTWISSHTSTTTNADSREVVFPTTETFRIGTPVTVAAGKVVRAAAATRESARILGLVKSTSEQNVTVQIDGVFSELNGLTPGQTYFLDVDGDLTASAPIGAFISQIGWALAADSLRLTILSPVKV